MSRRARTATSAVVAPSVRAGLTSFCDGNESTVRQMTDAGAGDDQVTIRGQYNDVYGGDGTDHLAIFLPGGAIDERAGKIEGFESQEVGLDDAAGLNKGEGSFAPAA